MQYPFTISSHPGGLSDVNGFSVGAAGCDIRNKGNDRLDVTLVHSKLPCTVAGTFTVNSFKAAPVLLCQKVLSSARPCHGFVANSGNANACTGERGYQDALHMQRLAEASCHAPAGSFMVASTGRIGEFLPMEKLRHGIEQASARLGDSGEGLRGADAILTSDTRRKVITVAVPTPVGVITLSGCAKGAGMIQPGMATMLAFLATDARIAQHTLAALLKDAVDDSFNAITVDGDMSTNDTVLLLANGASAIDLDAAHNADVKTVFRAALRHVCSVLAEQIVGDGEKITKVVDIRVTGALSRAEAEKAARAIGNSLLVKSSWYGNDPNWGRLLDAVGYSGAQVVVPGVKLFYQDCHEDDVAVAVFADGLPLSHLKPRWKDIVSQARFRILLDLGTGGDGYYRLLASDLTEGYVNFNKSE